MIVKNWTRTDWLGAVGLAFCAVVAFTVVESAWYGDAPGYANSLVQGRLIEPGHLLWRPLGALAAELLGLNRTLSNSLWCIQFISLLAAVLTIVVVFYTVRLLCDRASAALVGALVLASNGFWTYAFSGCSYSLSVLFTALSVASLAVGATVQREAAQVHRYVIVAGVFGGLAAATWGIQVICAPALWVLAVATRARPATAKSVISTTAEFGVGYLFLLVLPLGALYVSLPTLGDKWYVVPTPAHLSLVQWIATSNHGLPATANASQIFRVLLGFPQSIVSIGDIPQELRLWMYKDGPFPLSIWLIAVVGSYVVLGIGFAAVVRNVTNSTQYRPYVWAGLTALVLNLAFALAWQGTDLERYFPSLPMQALLLGVAIAELKKIWPKHAVVGVGALILVIAAANVIGNFHRFLASDSFAQQWFRAAHKNARAGDLLIVSGNRKQQLSNPHDSNFPQVMVVSNIIAMFGNKWQSVADERIDLAKAGGHSIFIGDSVLDRRSVPRDGYSFKQFPEPSAAEIADKFAPLRANSVAFSVLGERVWNGK